MKPVRILLSVLLAVVVAVALPTPATAQIHACGDITIVFRNPDLQPDASNNFISAEGAFFAQFQLIGADADKVEVLGFSFGAYTTDIPESICQSPVWATGQQIINYRADTKADDGFFINLQTPLVPDGDYTAAVHAYDAADKELARWWAKAKVDNCDTAATPAQERCDGNAAMNQAHDKTGPWPIMLPGDGQRMTDVVGFSLEFAELVPRLTVTLNGVNITSELEAWEGRLWDDDLLPGYGPNGLGAALVEECSQQPPQECAHLGVAYKWNKRELTNDDVLRVEAYDAAGNVAIKSIHIGSAVAGGAITDKVPLLTHTVDALEKTVAPGETATFNFKITNSGAEIGHPFASAEAPAGWELEWQPQHVPVDAGQTKDQALLAIPPIGTPTGQYKVNATLTYQSGAEEKTIDQTLTVRVNSNAPVTGNNTSGPDSGKDKGSPGFGPVAMLLAAAVAVTLRRRRNE